MSTAPPRPCACGGCRRLVRGGGRCRVHQRPSAAARGYTHAWAVYARAWLARYPWCGTRADGQAHRDDSWCVRRGVATRATVVDHIRAIRHGGDVFAPANHQSLCAACNARKR